MNSASLWHLLTMAALHQVTFNLMKHTSADTKSAATTERRARATRLFYFVLWNVKVENCGPAQFQIQQPIPLNQSSTEDIKAVTILSTDDAAVCNGLMMSGYQHIASITRKRNTLKVSITRIRLRAIGRISSVLWLLHMCTSQQNTCGSWSAVSRIAAIIAIPIRLCSFGLS